MRFLIFLVVFFCVDLFAVCEETTATIGTFSGYVLSSPNVPSACSARTCDYDCTECEEGKQIGSWYYTNVEKGNFNCTSFGASCGGVWCSNQYGNCIAKLRCSDRCEAIERQCQQQGLAFDPNLCKCFDVCSGLETKCIQSGGRFTGRALTVNGQTCCSAVCDRCNTEANEQIIALKRKYCCDAGFAPPAEGQNCYSPPGLSGCGMTTLQRLTDTGEYLCRDPNSSPEASEAFYNECFSSSSGGSSSSGDAGSSGGGSSSSGGGSSGGGSSGGSPYGDCPECPWLDSILDTLTRQKWLVEDIYTCITMPWVCGNSNNNSDSVVVSVDSSILGGVTSRQDETLDFLNQLLERSGKIDTTLLSILEKGGSSVDTLILRAVNGGFSSVDTSLDRINNNIVSSRHRLDTLINRIPPDVFDSIRKYQESSLDLLDTLVYGRGVGFSLVDSLNDTIRKYFNVSHYYDSLYLSMFGSFDSTFKDKMENLSIAIDYDPLGYGDTASTTLRRDIEGVRAAIASLDSSVSGGFADIVGLLTPGSVDSSSVGYASGFAAEGERISDSLLRAIGWLGGLDTVNIDSVFSRAGFDSLDLDSVGRAVDDSLNYLADSLNSVLVSQNDSIKRGLPDSLDVWADSLVSYGPWASFDSLIFGQLGAKIPNSNECPEDCQQWSINLPRFGLFSFTVDYGLCLGRLPFGGMNVLGFVRLLLRIVTVWSCIWIVFNALTRRKD